jgi:hypothetical protein
MGQSLAIGPKFDGFVVWIYSQQFLAFIIIIIILSFEGKR